MKRELLKQLDQLLRPIKIRLANSIARAVVQVVDDSKRMQLIQAGVLADEDVEGAERFQNYGFNSVPLAGAECVVVFPNGDRAHGLVVAADDRRHRPTGWQPGEVGMFTDQGVEVKLLRGGEIRIGHRDGPHHFVARAADLTALKAIFDAWVPVPNDGGAALKTALAAWVLTASAKIKVE